MRCNAWNENKYVFAQCQDFMNMNLWTKLFVKNCVHSVTDFGPFTASEEVWLVCFLTTVITYHPRQQPSGFVTTHLSNTYLSRMKNIVCSMLWGMGHLMVLSRYLVVVSFNKKDSQIDLSQDCRLHWQTQILWKSIILITCICPAPVEKGWKSMGITNNTKEDDSFVQNEHVWIDEEMCIILQMLVSISTIFLCVSGLPLLLSTHKVSGWSIFYQFPVT